MLHGTPCTWRTTHSTCLLARHMSIWTPYHALADYITLKYFSEFHTVIETTTSLIDRELETQSLSKKRGLAQARRNFYRTVEHTVTTIKAAPSITTYERSAHSCVFSPEIYREGLPHGIRLIRGPPRNSLFCLKPALHRWQDRLLIDDLSHPELLFALLWEASHGLFNPSRFARDVLQ